MKIGVIGSNGLVGSCVYDMLGSDGQEVVGIIRQNYDQYIGDYDVVINANGNSRKYWADAHPVEDFEASVLSVYKSIFDFECGLYVYISTCDVYNNSEFYEPREHYSINVKALSTYGYNKLMAESIIKKYKKKYIILRCSAILGKGLKKGPVYDALNHSQLFVTPDSCIQFISTTDIAEVIKTLLYKGVYNETYNVGGVGTTSIKFIEELVGYTLSYSEKASYQRIMMDVDKLQDLFPLKSSDYYVKEIIDERME